MDRTHPFTIVLLSSIFVASLSACSAYSLANPPEAEFQDVSISLNTVNPEEQLHHFEYDRNQPLDVQVVKTWRRYNVTVTELTFESPRGERVPTLLFEPDGEGPFAGLVLMHGAPGTKENFLDLGVYYARYGFVAVAIDAPQFRSSHNIGHVSMALIWPRFEEKDVEEQSQLIVDLQRAVDLLLSRGNVDPDRLTYIGGSYGGAMGGLFAGVETRLDSYVLKVGDGGIIEHLSEPDEHGIPNTLPRWVNLLWPLEPLHFVGRAAPAALLFQNGISDRYVPTSDSLRYQQAGSDPKTIIWYNAGHFLPKRHYFDHLMWQHARIGAPTIVLKPWFNSSSLIWDRLLIVWFLCSALCTLYLVWAVLINARAGLRVTLIWLLVSIVLGPLSLLAYWYLSRPRDPAMPFDHVRYAIRGSLWLVTITMIAIAILEQFIFLSYLEWRVEALTYYFVPQVAAIIALIIRWFIKRNAFVVKKTWAVQIFTLLFLSTLISISAYFLINTFAMRLIHFHFPLYHPVMWFIIMITSTILTMIFIPVHLIVRRVGLPVWTVPIEGGELAVDPDPRNRWWLAVGAVLFGYVCMFLFQVYLISLNTPVYLTYADIAKGLLGFGMD